MVMPLRELERIKALKRFLDIEFTREGELQKIVEIAAEICECPIALITLVDEDTQHVRFRTGTELQETKRADAFCNHTIRDGRTLIVPDAEQDARFTSNPLVTGDPNIRFYAGAPLVTTDGNSLGSLCVIDTRARLLSEPQKRMLEFLRGQAMNLLEFEASVSILKAQYMEARESEIRIRAFFESSSTCHLLIDSDFRVIHFNRALADFVLETSGTEVRPGQRLSDFINREYALDFEANFRRGLQGEPTTIERELHYTDRSIWWYITYEPAFAPDGSIIGVSCNATNINDRKRYEQKILAQNEALRKVAFFQSHELRRPVASIIGLVGLMQSTGPEGLGELVRLLNSAAKELDGKIHDVMDSVNGAYGQHRRSGGADPPRS